MKHMQESARGATPCVATGLLIGARSVRKIVDLPAAVYNQAPIDLRTAAKITESCCLGTCAAD